jgi:hypothetical protein
MLPLLQASYHGYNPPLWTLLLQPALMVAAFALGAALLGRRQLQAFGAAAAVGTAAFAIVFMLQGKNFQYQAIPALGLALMVLTGVLIGRSGTARLVATAGLLFALLVPLKAGGARHDRVFVQAVQGLSPGDGVAMLSASQALAWPAMYNSGLAYRARIMGLWMVLSPWQAELERSGNGRMTALGHRGRRELGGRDRLRRPGNGDRRQPSTTTAGSGLETCFAWLMRQPTASVSRWPGYRRVQQVFVLRRFVPRPAKRHALCRKRHHRETRALPWKGASALKLILLEQVVKGRTADPEQLGGARDVVLGPDQPPENGAAFRLFAGGA